MAVTNTAGATKGLKAPERTTGSEGRQSTVVDLSDLSRGFTQIGAALRDSAAAKAAAVKQQTKDAAAAQLGNVQEAAITGQDAFAVATGGADVAAIDDPRLRQQLASSQLAYKTAVEQHRTSDAAQIALVVAQNDFIRRNPSYASDVAAIRDNFKPDSDQEGISARSNQAALDAQQQAQWKAAGERLAATPGLPPEVYKLTGKAAVDYYQSSPLFIQDQKLAQTTRVWDQSKATNGVGTEKYVADARKYADAVMPAMIQTIGARLLSFRKAAGENEAGFQQAVIQYRSEVAAQISSAVGGAIQDPSIQQHLSVIDNMFKDYGAFNRTATETKAAEDSNKLFTAVAVQTGYLADPPAAAQLLRLTEMTRGLPGSIAQVVSEGLAGANAVVPLSRSFINFVQGKPGDPAFAGDPVADGKVAKEGAALFSRLYANPGDIAKLQPDGADALNFHAHTLLATPKNGKRASDAAFSEGLKVFASPGFVELQKKATVPFVLTAEERQNFNDHANRVQTTMMSQLRTVAGGAGLKYQFVASPTGIAIQFTNANTAPADAVVASKRKADAFLQAANRSLQAWANIQEVIQPGYAAANLPGAYANRAAAWNAQLAGAP
ncbi:MAG: hypothetical protein M0P95_17805 [Sulfuritalea sp.]|jgi:hypothetical protein|nr:hypothetical protein [Sulfuritalea sp.]